MRLKTRERLMGIRKRLVHRVAILPTLLTLGNLLSGFGAIVYSARFQFESAAWMIFLAMLFDSLDGKVARLTKAATHFGGELDSLCDVVSFGVAPAFLAFTLMCHPVPILPGKFVWLVCALYAVCAALRLARFNVENAPEDSAHQKFKGLPSPAAAGVVSSAILFYLSFLDSEALASSSHVLPRLLPYLVLLAGLMMVSQVSYSHVVNRLFRGRRPFTTLVEVVLVAVLIALKPEITLFVGFMVYFLTGPVRHAWRLVYPLPAAESPPAPPAVPDPPPPAAPEGEPRPDGKPEIP